MVIVTGESLVEDTGEAQAWDPLPPKVLLDLFFQSVALGPRSVQPQSPITRRCCSCVRAAVPLGLA